MNGPRETLSPSAELERSSTVLLAAVAVGDHVALSELYDRFAPTLNGLCHRLVRPEDTDAALSAVWLFIWKHAPALSQLPGTTKGVLLNATARVITQRNPQPRKMRNRTHSG
ncbi:hypothetical protein B7R25_17115 [Subtercola boreus]|uniref:RNA polymerase sigma-70 region 2 domain-containing protein n=1 Tax=Subtercola boreus TaxID=120213 RepID=A0A3E0W5F0_9MICO|nr:hypothetical protein B7R23_17150 [Subtercola boreus]RFA17699.1 hypothetical protein B7R24_16645 [Subtercola boreus]RFA24244.1 hypothetical protein B7R25_17115 [Subtercola boreus]